MSRYRITVEVDVNASNNIEAQYHIFSFIKEKYTNVYLVKAEKLK